MDNLLLKQCVEDIVRLANEARQEPYDEFIAGKLAAFADVFYSLRTNLVLDGPENYGLDFDIDKILTDVDVAAVNAG